MPYDDIPTENAPALAPRVDEYLFEIAARIDTTDEKDWMCAADPDFGL